MRTPIGTAIEEAAMKSKKILSSIMVVSMLLSVSACGKKSESTTAAPETSAAETKAESQVPELDGYKLLWNDEFDGDKMDESKWNYEPHEPG